MSAFEKHWTVRELAEQWRLSVGVVRNLFRDRGDVLHIGHGETRSTRGYMSIRIPESVATRVYDELKKKI